MRILIAFQDLSTIEDALQIENALRFAAQFTCRTDEPPTVLVNIESGVGRIPPYVDTILAEVCLRTPIPAFRPEIRVGNLGKNIRHEIEVGNYDLVIVRECPNNRLGRFFRITRATLIAERAPCPVIVIKGKIGPIQRILMCDSGSPESPLLGKFTAQLVDLLPGEQDITILHVMSQISAGPGVQGEQLRANADELIETQSPEGEFLERDLGSLDQPGLHPVPKVRHGLVVDEIMAEANSGNYDLIIIGVFRQKWQRLLLTDLSRQIIDKTDRPVLIVK